MENMSFSNRNTIDFEVMSDLAATCVAYAQYMIDRNHDKSRMKYFISRIISFRDQSNLSDSECLTKNIKYFKVVLSKLKKEKTLLERGI